MRRADAIARAIGRHIAREHIRAWEQERRGARPAEQEVHLRVAFSQADPKPVPKTPEIIAALRARLAVAPDAAEVAALAREVLDHLEGLVEARERGVLLGSASLAGAPVNRGSSGSI